MFPVARAPAAPRIAAVVNVTRVLPRILSFAFFMASPVEGGAGSGLAPAGLPKRVLCDDRADP
jgi:hypothetical protein